MEEFNWSKPELPAEDIERWVELENLDVDADYIELNVDDADALIEEYEFDLQPRLLKKKEKKEIEFFVEYDKLTNDILEITPEKKIEPSSVRHGIFSTKQHSIINRIFDGKIPLSKLHVRHKRNRLKEISLGPSNMVRSEFDYIFAHYNTSPAPIHIYCDYVLKKLTINLDYQKMKYYLSLDNLTESKLERNNGHFNIFCVDRKDRTKLYDKININLFELCNIQRIEKKCFWLPDNLAHFDNNIGFVYYNNELPITYSLSMQEENTNSYEEEFERPQIVYKQIGSKLLLQSIMKDTNNFKINQEIIIYIFSKYDPSRLIEYKKIDRSVFDNFNLYEIELNYGEPVKLTSNHHHIHLEDSDVSTYYRI